MKTILSKPPIFNPSVFGFNLYLEYIKYIQEYLYETYSLLSKRSFLFS